MQDDEVQGTYPEAQPSVKDEESDGKSKLCYGTFVFGHGGPGGADNVPGLYVGTQKRKSGDGVWHIVETGGEKPKGFASVENATSGEPPAAAVKNFQSQKYKNMEWTRPLYETAQRVILQIGPRGGRIIGWYVDRLGRHKPVYESEASRRGESVSM